MEFAVCPLLSLFLLHVTVVTSYVEPPTNVTLHCKNFTNILKWDYDELVPELKFKVDFNAYDRPPKELLVDSPFLQADVSELHNPTTQYWLAVTAVIGKNKSETVPQQGIVFSYYKNSPRGQICFLELPPVNVTTKRDNKIHFSFEHPWLLYRQKLPNDGKVLWKKKKALPDFEYTVLMSNKSPARLCTTSVCEDMLPVEPTDPAQMKHCLKIDGEMLRMSVKGKRDYCALPFEDPSPNYNANITIAASVATALLIMIIIISMVIWKWTKAPDSLPRFMTFKPSMPPGTLKTKDEQFSVLEVESTSPTLLLMDTETIARTEFHPCDLSSEGRLKMGVQPEDDGMTDVTDERQQNGEGPNYMEDQELEEDDAFAEERSPYEKRDVEVQLAPDELAIGYRV